MTKTHARNTAVVALAAAFAVGLGGCSALGIERAESSSPSRSATKSGSGTATTTPTGSASPTPRGPDATAPADGVGTLNLGTTDRWTMRNEDDDILVEFIATPEAPQLAAAQQTQVSTWTAEYRDLRSRSHPTSDTTDTAPTGGASSGPTPGGSPSIVTQAGTATPTSSTATSSATTSPETTGPATPTSPDLPTPGGTGPDDPSLRVVPQLLSTGRVVGVRLYARMTDGEQVREHVRTFWADPQTGEQVPATSLFTVGQVSQVRRLVLAEPAGAQAGALSDEDLFGAAAFSTDGDLVLYLPGQDASDIRVVVPQAQVSPLLSTSGRAAQGAARDAVVPEPTTTDSDEPAEPATATPTP